MRSGVSACFLPKPPPRAAPAAERSQVNNMKLIPLVFIGIVLVGIGIDIGAALVTRLMNSPDKDEADDKDMPLHTNPRVICPRCQSMSTHTRYSGRCRCQQCNDCGHIYNVSP